MEMEMDRGMRAETKSCVSVIARSNGFCIVKTFLTKKKYFKGFNLLNTFAFGGLY